MAEQVIVTEFAEVVVILVDLQKEGKMGSKFTEYMNLITLIKDDWMKQKKAGVPEQFGVIKALAQGPDTEFLLDYLHQLSCVHDNVFDKDDGIVFQASELEKEQEVQGIVNPKSQSIAYRACEIVFDLIDGGACSDLFDQITCKDILQAILYHDAEKANSKAGSAEQSSCEVIISLYNDDNLMGLKQYIRELVMFSTRQYPGTSSAQASSPDDDYTADITTVLKIVQDAISLKPEEYDDASYVDVVAYLSLQEHEWQKSASSAVKLVLPPHHRDIMFLKREGANLHKYIQKLVKESRAVFALEKVDNHLKQNQDVFAEDGSIKAESIASVIGSTLTVGLSTLHVIAPAGESAFKSLISQLDLQLLNPALSGWGTIAGVSGVFLAGICIWNAYKVYKGNRTIREASKNVLDAVVPMAISSLGGYILAFAFASASPPILLSLSIFGGIGLGLHLIVSPIVKRFTTWLFDDIPPPRAITKAYKTLGIDETATDEEVRTAHRRKCQKYHPDMHARRNATQQQIEEAQIKFLEAQQAYQFIVTTRISEMNNTDADGILARVKNFFSSLFYRNSSEDGTNDETSAQANYVLSL